MVSKILQCILPLPPYSAKHIIQKIVIDERIDKITVVTKTDVDTKIMMGAIAAMNGNFDEGMKQYNEVLKLSQDYAVAYYCRAFIYLANGDFDRAIEDFNRTITLDPSITSVYVFRADSYVFTQQFDKAIEDLSKILMIYPDLAAAAYKNRASCYENLGQYHKAIEDSTKAIELDPNFAAAYMTRGVAANKIGRLLVENDMQRALELFDSARRDLNKAIELNPNSALAYYNRAVIFVSRNELKRALEDFNKAIELNPNDADFYFDRGVVYHEIGQYDRAIEDYTKTIELMPTMSKAYINRAYVRLEKEELSKAIEDFKKAIELEPDNAQYKTNLRIAQQSLGQPKDDSTKLGPNLSFAGINEDLIQSEKDHGIAHEALRTAFKDKQNAPILLGIVDRTSRPVWAVKGFEDYTAKLGSPQRGHHGQYGIYIDIEYANVMDPVFIHEVREHRLLWNIAQHRGRSRTSEAQKKRNWALFSKWRKNDRNAKEALKIAERAHKQAEREQYRPVRGITFIVTIDKAPKKLGPVLSYEGPRPAPVLSFKRNPFILAALNNIPGKIRILFLCKDNLLRSPFMEEELKALCQAEGITDFEVFSRGVDVGEDEASVSNDMGLPYFKSVEQEDIEKADIIIAAEAIHIVKLLEQFPEAGNKPVFLFNELVNSSRDLPNPSLRHRIDPVRREISRVLRLGLVPLMKLRLSTRWLFMDTDFLVYYLTKSKLGPNLSYEGVKVTQAAGDKENMPLPEPVRSNSSRGKTDEQTTKFGGADGIIRKSGENNLNQVAFPYRIPERIVNALKLMGAHFTRGPPREVNHTTLTAVQ